MKPYHEARSEVVAAWERSYLTVLMESVGGDLKKGAKIAGVSQQTLYRLMQFHGGVRTFRKAAK